MKSRFLALTAAVLMSVLCAVCPVALCEENGAGYGILLQDMMEAWISGTGSEKIDADADQLNNEVAKAVADHWKKVWLDPDYRLYLFGQDDPAQLPVTGKHAFVVLGFRLEDGEMAGELKGRCDAAAAAAKAFPDSLLVCSGGATGKNNPENHTEAGLMKAYLTETCGIKANRILIDERAMSTEENAVNTFVILQEHGVETMTIITSAYHQRRGQTLYNALSALYRQEHGYSAEIVGNFCYDIESEEMNAEQDMSIAILQLASILQLPEDQMEVLGEKLNAFLWK